MARTTGPADPTDPAHQRRTFAALPLEQRRAVARAVSRGHGVEDPTLAFHAVVVARRQQRLWRWMWLTGPAIGLTQVGLGWQVAAVAVVVSTLAMALISRFWFDRARRAEERNLDLIPAKQRRRLR